MIQQPFYGELYIEDAQLGKKSLYINVFMDENDHVLIQLHNAPPPFSFNTWIGNYGSRWLLKRVKKRLLVTVFEITFLEENESVKARCLTGHKFGRMIEQAISSQT
jgi:hypothetical protein